MYIYLYEYKYKVLSILYCPLLNCAQLLCPWWGKGRQQHDAVITKFHCENRVFRRIQNGKFLIRHRVFMKTKCSILNYKENFQSFFKKVKIFRVHGDCVDREGSIMKSFHIPVLSAKYFGLHDACSLTNVQCLHRNGLCLLILWVLNKKAALDVI